MSASELLTLVLALQGVSLIVLTLFAPFAIGVLISYFTNANRKTKSLEQRVLITRSLNKWFLFIALIALLVLPFSALLMPTIPWLFVIALIAWVVFIGYFVRAFYRFYEWVSDKEIFISDYFAKPLRISNKQKWDYKILITFVKSINLDKKVRSWGNLWELSFSEQDYPHDEEFFAHFVKDVDSLLQSKKGMELNALVQLISDFSCNIQNRSRSIFALDEFLTKILDWYHTVVWLDDAIRYGTHREIIERVEGKIDELVERVTDEAVKKPEYRKQFFEVIGRCEPKYLKMFSFFNLLNSIARLELRDMTEILEEEIPPTWETTRSKVNDYLLEQALRWFELWWEGINRNGEVRPSEKSSKFTTRNVDKVCRMNAVARSLFPKSTPVKLVRLIGIKHSISQYSPLAMTNAYQLEGIFYEDRLMPVGVKIREELNEERLNWTVDFILHVYSHYFTLERLQGWQRELEKCDTLGIDPDKSLGIQAWLEIIEVMIRRLNKPNAKADSADEQADSSARQTD